MALYENKIKILMTLSSQAGWSGMNFLVTALLARYLEPAAFGVLGLFLASKRGVLLFTGGALLIPLTVITSILEGDEKELFIHKLVIQYKCNFSNNAALGINFFFFQHNNLYSYYYS